MKYRILIVFLAFFCFAAGYAEAAPQKGIFIDKEAEALVRIFVNCNYSILLKSPANKEIKISVTKMGNGFFSGEEKIDESLLYGEGEAVVTASHILLCDSTVGDLDKSGIFSEYQKNSKDNISVENIAGFKDSKLVSTSAFTANGRNLSDIQEIFISPAPHMLNDPDRALLKVRVDPSIPHSHIPLMDDKVFDEIFLKDGIKKSVYLRGFISFIGGWFVRYKDAEIEWVGENTIQINEHLDKGLSGSPLLFNYNGKTYALGVLSSTPLEQTGRFYDWSWISITKKSFLNSKQKKK